MPHRQGRTVWFLKGRLGGRALLVMALIAGAATTASTQAPADPMLDPVLARMGAYISGYGEKAALVVAIEEYTQTVMFEGAAAPTPPRRLITEFALGHHVLDPWNRDGRPDRRRGVGRHKCGGN